MMMIIWIVTVVYGSLDICLSKDINEIKKYDYSQTCLRERPFNLKWGGYGFFLKKYSDSQCCWKNILILVEEKKKSDSEFLSYNLMINSGNKIRALHNKKNKYSNSCVVKLNGRSLITHTLAGFCFQSHSFNHCIPVTHKFIIHLQKKIR